MDTNNSRKRSAKDRTRAWLALDPHAQRLLEYYGLSLIEPMSAPRFGAQHFSLNIYNDQHQQTPRLVMPSLEYLSQDLGFVEHAGYGAVRDLQVNDFWKQRMRDDALTKGKYHLRRYLQHLRPLLLERDVYFYCTTSPQQLLTEVATAKFASEKGKRPLHVLPTSVEAAGLMGASQEDIEMYAPEVAWLIPKLVLYRKVEKTDQLQSSFDGWLACLTPQQKEQMHTLIVKYAFHLVTDEITGLLLPKWLKEG
jgi:hypothetical protein